MRGGSAITPGPRAHVHALNDPFGALSALNGSFSAFKDLNGSFGARGQERSARAEEMARWKVG
ncbi:hypothetical protein GCM10022247_41410 [Allokutzneria multivorans]|uniref:Uncharacterized protein n=1 Tax=Allokutzneria multivorans TaxID=1142134 RepID=A0ABP7SP97_9PSEU